MFKRQILTEKHFYVYNHQDQTRTQVSHVKSGQDSKHNKFPKCSWENIYVSKYQLAANSKL